MTDLAEPAAPLAIKTLDAPGHVFEPLPARVRRHAAERPDAPALAESGGKVIAWGEVSGIVARAAAKLMACGVTRGDVIPVLANAPVEYTLAYLAGLTAAGCVAPLPVMAADDTLTRMIADGEGPVMIASADYRERAVSILAADPAIAGRRKLALDFEAPGWEPLFDPSAPAPETLPEIGPDDLFNIIYSSGTTGVPKGIVHDHMMRTRQWPRMHAKGMDADSRMILSTPLYSNTTLAGLLPLLAAGGFVRFQRKFDAADWFRIVAEEKITNTMLVPVLVQRLMTNPDFASADISSLKLTTCTSSPLAPTIKKRMLDEWPGEVMELYGLTEGGIGTALDLKVDTGKWASVGKAAPGAELMVIDEDLNVLPVGKVGEVVGRSATVMRGYHGREDLTQKALVRLADGEVYFRTGDLGRIDEDGFLFLAGRKKDMIISGGFNIYATDLEEALHSHPDVLEAGVAGAPDEEWGEIPWAGVVLRPGATVTEAELIAHANARLGKLQRIKRVFFIEVLPRNAIEKVDKPNLLKLLLSLA